MKKDRDDDLAAELNAHLAAHIDDNIRAGMAPAEARRSALLKLGGTMQTTERVRDAASMQWLDEARLDLRHTFRSLRRAPGFALAAIAVIALGIAATTAAFAVLDHVLLRPLPFPQADRLVRIYQSDLARGMTRIEASPPNFEDWRSGSRSFSGVASFLFGNYANLLANGEPRQIDTATLDADVLTVLGVQPLVGRGFMATDMRDNFLGVVLLGYDFAISTFGSPAAALNRTINLDNRARTVIGVMPAGFSFPSREPKLWMPMPPVTLLGQSRTNLLLNVVGRLQPGVSITQAQADMNVMAERLRRAYPKDNAGVSISVVDMRDVVSPQARMLIWTVFAAALCLLLIVCTNLTNLLLARAVARRQEIAIRVAIGAGSWRILRQMLTESVLLASAGGVLGAGLAMAAVPLIARIVPNVLPVSGEPAVDVRVLAFAALVTVITCLAVGVMPALKSSRTVNVQLLRVRAGLPVARLRSVLVIAEIAATVTLLVAGGLLVKAMWRVQSVDPGFNANGVLTLRTNLSFLKYPDSTSRRSFYTRVLTGTQALPGVVSVGYTTGLPLVLGGGITVVTVPGVVDDPATAPRASVRFVTPDYLATMHIPLRHGRLVDGRDTAGTPSVVVISESLARRLWPNQDPIGRQITIFNHTRTVVGVAGDIIVRGLERTSEPQLYMSPEQLAPFSIFYSPRDLVVRTSNNAMALAPDIRKIIHDADPEQPISDLRLFDDVVAEQTASRRDQVLVLGLFAAVAFLLAAIGIYGLLSYTVQARTQEVGLRVALGAQPSTIARMFLAQGVALSLAGIAVGLATALAGSRLMASLLYGVSSRDPGVFVGAAVALLTIALLACWLPARRAAAVDPLVALRAE
jgi:putative ABC transport system permease protein